MSYKDLKVSSANTEVEFFDDSFVRITDSLISISSTTYTLLHILSVREAEQIVNSKVGRIYEVIPNIACILLAILLIIVEGFSTLSVVVYGWCIIIYYLLKFLLILIIPKKYRQKLFKEMRYSLYIGMSYGEQEILCSNNNPAYIKKVGEALSKAIAYRG